MFYKIGAMIEKLWNCFLETVFESTFNGWKGWILLISLFFAFIFWQFHHSFKPNSITFKELIIFGVFSIIFYLILFFKSKLSVYS